MYYVMRASAPSLHRESTDSLIYIYTKIHVYIHNEKIYVDVCIYRVYLYYIVI